MTGYGDAEGRLDSATYIVEIKTLNNRYFKTNVRLPESLAFLEDNIDKLLRQNLSRGMVNFVLRVKEVSAENLFEIDEKALQSVVERLKNATSSTEDRCSIEISALLNLPGILVAAEPDEQKAQSIKEMVLDITGRAIEKLKQMRAAEGQALAADLQQNCQAVKQNLDSINARSDIVIQEYHKKLEKRVNDLLAHAKLQLDQDTLAREVAIFAERSDISEEIARLDSHLQQFAQICQAGGQAGRRMDFISQEMLREANTIASKACDTEIARWVVEIKCLTDRIKEQIQNVE